MTVSLPMIGGSVIIALFLFSILSTSVDVGATGLVPVHAGIYTDGRHNVQVAEAEEDPSTFVRWVHVYVRFGRLGFYFNPRSGDISDFPYPNDPRDPVDHAPPVPYVLEQRTQDDRGHHFRWRRGGLWAFADVKIEMSVSPAGHITRLTGLSWQAALASRMELAQNQPRFHSGPVKMREYEYVCENLRPGHDRALDPTWFLEMFPDAACPENLESTVKSDGDGQSRRS